MRKEGQYRNPRMDRKAANPRQLVLKILTDFDNHPGNLDKIIELGLKGTHLDHRDRRLVFEIVYGVLRHKLTLDYITDHYLTDKSPTQDQAIYRVLRIGIYQLVYMNKIPDHAAVNESVKLAKTDKESIRYSSVINAVLRNFISNKKIIPLPDPQKNLTYRLSIEFSHPEWMIERWLKSFGLSKTKQLLAFNNEKPPVYLRRKIRDISKLQFEADVRTICEQGSGYLNLYYKLKKALLPENLHLIQEGMCNVQAPSSGWIVALMDIKKGEHLLDLCAAPGGKTALMSELAGEGGTVCSCDIKWQRLQSIVETINRMNLRNVYPLVCDGTSAPFTGVFDKVLLDVPCSGTGVLNRHPEARWTRKVDDIANLAETQKKLLDTAATLIGKGGILVYSTCSMEPEENQNQIERFLKDHPDFRLDAIPESIPDKYIDNKGFISITPYEHGMDGMFGARLRKIG